MSKATNWQCSSPTSNCNSQNMKDNRVGILTEISAFPSKFTVLSKYFCNARICQDYGHPVFIKRMYQSNPPPADHQVPFSPSRWSHHLQGFPLPRSVDLCWVLFGHFRKYGATWRLDVRHSLTHNMSATMSRLQRFSQKAIRKSIFSLPTLAFLSSGSKLDIEV